MNQNKHLSIVTGKALNMIPVYLHCVMNVSIHLKYDKRMVEKECSYHPEEDRKKKNCIHMVGFKSFLIHCTS
ncbi:hypothetical protein [Peribacillus sp. R9-11]|uniref:hypothetical protein n=1 Tax=Peribacillus sp. R9-11 TaxID=3073271 RepID=UPI0028691967|nr:hypothetical protein [Peribacillus sp. R9-11]WMX58635.1 hypothetical protein RE409_29510 [Peribacillus sp. R9-11]